MPNPATVNTLQHHYVLNATLESISVISCIKHCVISTCVRDVYDCTIWQTVTWISGSQRIPIKVKDSHSSQNSSHVV